LLWFAHKHDVSLFIWHEWHGITSIHCYWSEWFKFNQWSCTSTRSNNISWFRCSSIWQYSWSSTMIEIQEIYLSCILSQLLIMFLSNCYDLRISTMFLSVNNVLYLCFHSLFNISWFRCSSIWQYSWNGKQNWTQFDSIQRQRHSLQERVSGNTNTKHCLRKQFCRMIMANVKHCSGAMIEIHEISLSCILTPLLIRCLSNC
jgi:hypothetical protein